MKGVGFREKNIVPRSGRKKKCYQKKKKKKDRIAA